MIGSFLAWLVIVGFAHSVDYQTTLDAREKYVDQGCHLGIPTECDEWAAIEDEKETESEDQTLINLAERMR